MKKIFMWTFGLLLSFSFASCGGDDLIADLPDNSEQRALAIRTMIRTTPIFKRRKS